MRTLLIGLIWFYRKCISPLMGPRCRFQPTCSEYAIDVIKTHGILRGIPLMIKRIGKCHPWGAAGFDPPPPSTKREMNGKRK